MRPGPCAALVPVLCSVLTTAGVRADDRALDAAFADAVAPALARNCAGCHDRAKHKAGLDVTTFRDVPGVVAALPRWQQIREQLASGDMPPSDADVQPAAPERAALVAWIDSLLAREAQRNAGDPGTVLARRLSNAEYDHTIRDLVGIDLQPARAFPIDPANAAGFDNSGESLQMSPTLLAKYVTAAQDVASHVVLRPHGLSFAPFPVITETDRDRYCVRRIVDFYRRQPTDLAAYFRAAARVRAGATIAASAAAEQVSVRYLEVVWHALQAPHADVGPLAAVAALWRAMPAPNAANAERVRVASEKLRDVVVALRARTKVEVPNLKLKGVNPGSQTFVLWKDRTMAAARRRYGGGALDIDLTAADFRPIAGTPAARLLTVPRDARARARYEATWTRFADVFPDAFYVSERTRVFVEDAEEIAIDKKNGGRLLSAGFHNQMGFFRDDRPLYDLVLDETGRRELDALWQELDFVTGAPMRQHASFIWFERSESGFLRDGAFAFARSEDKDVVGEDKFGRFADAYTHKVETLTTDPVIVGAVRDHFRILEGQIRAVERARLDAEPEHLVALQRFAARAYRRPLSTPEREGLVAFYRRLRVHGGLSHEDAVRDVLVSILSSPGFLFRLDLQSRGASTVALAPLELASRLSYFLWSSMPDDELMARAIDGSLTEPAVLLAQVRRMARDERVRDFATELGGQWLDVRRFVSENAVDRGVFPAFDDQLRRSMFEEPIRLIEDAVRRDRSVVDLVLGSETLVDGPLARHYGLTAKSDGWTRVDAGAVGRGGLLGMAVFMTKNAPGLRTSPVKRGHWVATRILGDRIPPPPPNVPTLPTDERALGAATLREVLAKHRADPACSSCHARFDGYGLAYEGFGPVGERRDRDLSGHAIDARAEFPGGGAGDGLSGLRSFLRQHRQHDVERQVARKLLAFALGRSLIVTDDPVVDELTRNLERKGHRMSALIEGIVTSRPFLFRRGGGS